VAASTYGGFVLLFDAVTGELIESIRGHLNAVFGVAFSPDGRRLISADGGREAIKIWDVNTRQELLTLAGTGSFLHQTASSSVGFQRVSDSVAAGDRVGQDITIGPWHGAILLPPCRPIQLKKQPKKGSHAAVWAASIAVNLLLLRMFLWSDQNAECMRSARIKMANRTANESLETNRRPELALDAESELGIAAHDPSWLSGGGRSALR
jgi:WD40 repeat protein